MSQIERTLEEERRIINAYPYDHLQTETIPNARAVNVAAYEPHDDDDDRLSRSALVIRAMDPRVAERLAHSWNALPLRNAQVQAVLELCDPNFNLSIPDHAKRKFLRAIEEATA